MRISPCGRNSLAPNSISLRSNIIFLHFLQLTQQVAHKYSHKMRINKQVAQVYSHKTRINKQVIQIYTHKLLLIYIVRSVFIIYFYKIIYNIISTIYKFS